MLPNVKELRGELPLTGEKDTFHLDGELPQQLLQLRFNGAHILGRGQETGVRARLLSHKSSKHMVL